MGQSMSSSSARTVIVTTPWEVNQQLAELGLTTEIVRQVAHAAAAARAESLAVDPSFTGGMLSFIYGVRSMRLKLLPLGWEIRRAGNVEATVNDEINVQLFFQNVDRACGPADPMAVSGKGAAARDLVNSGQSDLFEGLLDITKPDDDHDNSPVVWLLCVSSDDSSVCAEVSCPEPFEGTQFQGFSKRIFVLNEPREPSPDPRRKSDSQELDFEIAVTKKSA
ncbi:hypothetical protein [Tahibacter harae]|uniref:Uncharacterized protein n=1 Tax=Tahibacter harae TaxID=2963937 RepID=A0ABT1QQY0_9GAMM|nr:hypothetical protein [Tahibacter harae]MCQ4164679.1 hypothetical protein [Tahibacter harae]